MNLGDRVELISQTDGDGCRTLADVGTQGVIVEVGNHFQCGTIRVALERNGGRTSNWWTVPTALRLLEERRAEVTQDNEVCAQCNTRWGRHQAHTDGWRRCQMNSTLEFMPSGQMRDVATEQATHTGTSICYHRSCLGRCRSVSLAAPLPPAVTPPSGIPGVPDPASIVIPELPDMTTPTTVPDRVDRADIQKMVFLDGQTYELYPVRRQVIDDFLRERARSVIVNELARLAAYKDQVSRTLQSLEQAINRVRTNSPAPMMTRAHAATGLRVWQENTTTLGVEKPMQFFPQMLFDGTKAVKIAPGQFQPRMVLAYAQWNHAAKTLSAWKLFDPKTGQRFMHHHSLGDHDCRGELPTAASNYDDILKIYQQWEQQLQSINLTSIGSDHPSGMPSAYNIRVLVETEVTGDAVAGAWEIKA